MGALLSQGWLETYRLHTEAPHSGTVPPKLLEDARQLQRDVQRLTAQGRLLPEGSDRLVREITRIAHIARSEGLSDMSNRRLVKMLHVMLVHRLYQLANQPGGTVDHRLGVDQLRLIGRYFLDRSDEEITARFDREVVT
jgi:hypothetical protein